MLIAIKSGLNLSLLLFFLFPYTGLLSCSAVEYQEKISIKEFFDLPYYDAEDADAEKHQLDLFIPEGIERPPIMIWIHGGAWAFGSRKSETALARKFAEEGIAVAAISYRLSPGVWNDPNHTTGVQHPEHIRDVARAFAWIYEQAETYHYDRHSIFVGGYSAGAQLSALLAVDPSYLTEVGRSVRDIKGAIPIAGAYDMEAYYHSHVEENGQTMADQHVKAVFGETMAQLREASPTVYIQNEWVPMLVVSETDTYDYTLLFEDAAQKVDNKKVEFYHVRDKNHSGLFYDLLAEKSTARDKVVEYIHQHKVDYRYLKKKDVTLAYKVFGKGQPLFLLNGGPGLPSHHFTPLAQKLAKNYTVILFDQRGTGYSSIDQKNSSTLNLKLMLEDLEDLRAHLGYKEVTLMGHSFGGIYALAYAAAYPEQVDKLILSHSGGMNLDFQKDISARLQSRLNEEERAGLNGLMQESNPELRNILQSKSIAAAYVYDRSLAPGIFKSLAFKARFYPEVNQLIFQDLNTINFDLTDQLKSFDQPVLIIHGDHDIVNPEVAKYTHRVFSNSNLLLLKKCGHYGWIEHPEKYFKAIHDFLDSNGNAQ